MKKKLYFQILVISISIFFFNWHTAIAQNNKIPISKKMEKADKFMQAGRYPQALALYSNVADQEPDNLEATLGTAKCHMKLGNLYKADEWFGYVVNLDPDQGNQIGIAYKEAGVANLYKGNIPLSRKQLNKAILYDPTLKPSIAKGCFSLGQKRLLQKNYSAADGYMFMASDYGFPRSRIGNFYFQQAQQTTDQTQKLALLKVSARYDRTRNTDYGQQLLIIAESQTNSSQGEAYLSRAAKILPKNQVIEVLERITTKKLGAKPIKIVLNSGNKVKAFDVGRGEKIHYLSLHDFFIYGEGFNDYTLSSSITETHGCKFNYIKSPSGKFPLYFKKKKFSTTVLVWKTKN